MPTKQLEFHQMATFLRRAKASICNLLNLCHLLRSDTEEIGQSGRC